MLVPHLIHTMKRTKNGHISLTDSRPSGLPETNRLPLTTRWVCRWTRWSAGLPLNTFNPAMEYEQANIFERKASADCATQGQGSQSQPFFPPYDDVDSFLVLASKWIRWFEAARSRQEHQKISVGTTAGHRGKYLYEDRRHSQYQISTGSLQIDNMCRYVRYHIHMQQNEHEQMYIPIVTVTTM